MHTPQNEAVVAPVQLDFQAIRVLANERFQFKAIDWDLRGSPITAVDVLMVGAYAPAARRLLDLVAKETDGPFTKERFAELAPVAFAQGTDLDFAGNVITNFSILTLDPHGFGAELYAMARLVSEQVTGQAAL